jgi:hypothetical protein
MRWDPVQYPCVGSARGAQIAAAVLDVRPFDEPVSHHGHLLEQDRRIYLTARSCVRENDSTDRLKFPTARFNAPSREAGGAGRRRFRRRHRHSCRQLGTRACRTYAAVLTGPSVDSVAEPVGTESTNPPSGTSADMRHTRRGAAGFLGSLTGSVYAVESPFGGNPNASRLTSAPTHRLYRRAVGDGDDRVAPEISDVYEDQDVEGC